MWLDIMVKHGVIKKEFAESIGKYIKKLKEDNNDLVITNYASFLEVMKLFPWEHTVEGYNYWTTIYHQLYYSDVFHTIDVLSTLVDLTNDNNIKKIGDSFADNITYTLYDLLKKDIEWMLLFNPQDLPILKRCISFGIDYDNRGNK